MIIGVPKETFPGEDRVAMVPANIPLLTKAGCSVIIEKGAGEAAGYPDGDYVEKGAEISPSRKEVFSKADVILQVRAGSANPDFFDADLKLMKKGQVIIGSMEPFVSVENLEKFAKNNITAFSMELMPRITRAQSMDILSSMATISGYKASLLAANSLPKMFPMFMTAAGTITPARVFIVGAGVAGLQAIATCRRLGALVQAYDVRPVVREQVESLGAKFVELELETGESEDKGGYAKAMDEEFYKKQREMMADVMEDSDVVITTAAIPGKKAPILITAEMVKRMKAGSVIVDIAAERGGNCELTKAGETVTVNGVKILGPVNLPATIPYHASQMFSKNLTTFLLSFIKEGALQFDPEDEVVNGTLVTKDGKIVNSMVREILQIKN